MLNTIKNYQVEMSAYECFTNISDLGLRTFTASSWHTRKNEYSYQDKARVFKNNA